MGAKKFSAMQLISVFGGAAGALFIIVFVDMEGLFGRSLPLQVLAFIISFVAAGYLQTIFHEFGHFVFGKLSGYEFVSFRIGKIMLVSESGKLKLKYYTIVGTGGQCLMMPPPWSEKLPTTLYNFGGVLMNLIVGTAGLFACFAFPENSLQRLFFASFFVTGWLIALTNGLPAQSGGISNDGSNALLVKKSPSAKHAFWLQLYVNGLLQKGERYRNMPADWFSLPEGDETKNSMTLQNGVLLYNYLFDSHDFERAEETAEYLISIPSLIGMSKNELLCELIFLRILRGAEPAEIEPLLTPSLWKYIAATKIYVSRKRLLYAYYLLYKRDGFSAEKALSDFEENAKRFPYSAEIESEREIIEIVREKAD